MAATGGQAGIGSELDEALVRAGRYLRRGVVSADLRTLEKSGGREADSFYRDRWSYDKVVRSTHGVNCTGSCSWKVYVKDGIITWEAQQTDYPSAGPDRPDYEPRGAARPASRHDEPVADAVAGPVPTVLRARACRAAVSPEMPTTTSLTISVSRYLALWPARKVDRTFWSCTDACVFR